MPMPSGPNLLGDPASTIGVPAEVSRMVAAAVPAFTATT
jgi:hypothetical protein